MNFKNIVSIVVGMLFAAFVFQNAEMVEVRFLVWSAQASRALVLICVFCLGLIVGWFPSWMKRKECAKDEDEAR
ncbi:hypothetical protein Dalk_1832 [Desulfatibacillum aliphaticivorans]|uniref:Lipopolysaccharide assembly protein A domain-containing protein n=1 Tax=Desulfatibacillum aliphaticivorans TaxID=218208 RepID=B8FFX4_DESAL|nr:LapA family protein [Desulfatibacillum aliphaticivorans]ACL03529.1 hypothetical protein Dalk_1832 [Desulfatibacillum aliphaticivorans]